MRDNYDDRVDGHDDSPPYPVTVTIAGISWIVFGGLLAVNMLILLVVVSAAPGAAQEDALALGGVLGVVMAIFAAAFIFVGVQSVRGTAPGTIGNAAGSIGLGLMNFVSLANLIRRGDYLQAGISIFFAVALIAAGVLAIVGSSDYKVWRQFQKAMQRREDRERDIRRRRRDDWEEQDRPRSRRDDDDSEHIRRSRRQADDD